uniref:Uncharacterized protein n=1 Tax=Timema bartmani TaxID=61472 RepID=A0A7R9EV32_9NEOP|nr:unnamed protein product [Timema bartmani]
MTYPLPLRPLVTSVKTNKSKASLRQIKVMCKADEEEEDSAGAVEECLKNAFLTGRIIDPGCRLEVANVIEEAKADIHVDPLLHQACGVDVSKFCSDIPQGAGRREYT